MDYIKQGTPSFRRALLALFAGGFNTFAILYDIQPLMPELSRDFHSSPTLTSLSLSLTTISMAISMLFVGSLSDAWGRKSIMTVSLFAASVLAVLTAISPDFHVLLVLRVIAGIVLAGLPAIAMTYLSEEIEPNGLGIAMGIYISGNSIGGMGGRIISGMVTDYFNWRIGIAVIGVLSLAATLLFSLTLPPSKHFRQRSLNLRTMAESLLSQFKDSNLVCIYALGFLLMGSFVTLYNYIGYQLAAPPYSLSQSLVGWIFIVYITGTFSSTWMGRLADRHPRHKVIWIALGIVFTGAVITLSGNLWAKIAGIAIFTFGFFGGHSVASSWIGKLAKQHKAQASSLYLFCYYVGSSIGGTTGGIFWTRFGWAGVIALIIFFVFTAFLVSLRLVSVSEAGHA
ncbi:MFS transporter [Desulfosporosinus sp. PR]|uniref:MFS transporter n=1 Tax=Candidatus Desulfosporosinus nitrosoreducens TaxID=3401928 RepID=UPI0027E97ADB|nr:MFS transporter [Desulfosporosinus sp. PR]MDQ7094851.1 MFS transporter [Desulfosporosinus sp. PR]